MPIFRSGEAVPAWCEMTHFDIVQLAAGERHTYARRGQKERLFVCEGECRIRYHGATVLAGRGAKPELTNETSEFEIVEVLAPTTLIRVCGHWGEVLGGSGLFSVVKSDHPQDKGDAVAYPKETNFDSHYHDYDEYWIFYKGSGTAVTEGKHFAFEPGVCVATGAGHHHDVPSVQGRVEAIFFETTVEAPGRRGHLWNHTHGPAQPRADRV